MKDLTGYSERELVLMVTNNEDLHCNMFAYNKSHWEAMFEFTDAQWDYFKYYLEECVDEDC